MGTWQAPLNGTAIFEQGRFETFPLHPRVLTYFILTFPAMLWSSRLPPSLSCLLACLLWFFLPLQPSVSFYLCGCWHWQAIVLLCSRSIHRFFEACMPLPPSHPPRQPLLLSDPPHPETSEMINLVHGSGSIVSLSKTNGGRSDPRG